MKKILSILCVLLITITLTGCGTISTSGAEESSVEQLLDLYVKSFEENKLETLYKVFPEFYIKEINMTQEKMTTIYERNKDEFGDDFKVTYKINSKEKISTDKLNQLNDNFKKYNVKVTECYEVNTTITFSGSKFTDPDTYPLGYCKIDGKWYIIE